MDVPSISVIIPAYNTEQTLPRCIDSVLAQSLGILEIIVVDDGSPDHVGDIAERYATQHEQVKVMHQANAGLAEARRAGLRAAHGEYIVHVDSDDSLPPHAIECLYNHAETHHLDMALGCYNRIVDDKQQVVTHHQTGIFDGTSFLMHLLDRRSICTCWANITRRDLWTDDVFPPLEPRLPSEDVMMLVFMTRNLRRVGIFNDVVYNYYYNPQSLSIAGPLHRQELWKRYFELLRDHLQTRGLLAQTEESLRIMEIERLAFCNQHIDRDEDWYRQVMAYRTRDFSPRIRLLHSLLHHPRLFSNLLALRRRF